MKTLCLYLPLACLAVTLAKAQSITPGVDAIERVSPGFYRYWFGYRSTFSSNVTLSSTVVAQGNITTRTDTFMPGRTFALFSASEGTVWQLAGSTATASFFFYSNFQQPNRPFLDQEKPFAGGGVLWFDYRTVTMPDGSVTYEFRWWRRDPASGKLPNDIGWDASNWLQSPRPGSVTYTLVLTDADRIAALARLGLTASPDNNKRALINEAFRRIDTISPPQP